MTTLQQLRDEAQELLRRGDVIAAIEAHRRLLSLWPKLADHWYNLGYLLQQARRYAEALEAYDEALRCGAAGSEEIHLNRAAVLAQHLARPDEAESAMQQALSERPGWLPALLNLGNLYEQRGRRALAQQAYEQALQSEPDHALALARLATVVTPARPDDPLLERLRRALKAPGRTAAEQADLGFALGRALDALGAHDEAFDVTVQANAACRSSAPGAPARYDRQAHERRVDRLIALSPRGGERLAAGGSETAATQRVFICGLFRSGSSLVEQILASHPQVTAGGELELMPTLAGQALAHAARQGAWPPAEFMQALRTAYERETSRLHPGATVLTDKRPDNFLYVGVILALFPDARIVHTLRDPLDNALSMFFLHLGPDLSYALDLADAGHWYVQHLRLMAHWKQVFPGRVLTLPYEALVQHPRPQIEALLAHVGLPWHEGCLDFHKADTVVRTPSTWQVREPLHPRAIGRWRPYEKHLDGLRLALAGPGAKP